MNALYKYQKHFQNQNSGQNSALNSNSLDNVFQADENHVYEVPRQRTNRCDIDNGGCEHECVDGDGDLLARCKCFPGYYEEKSIHGDELFHCRDIDECTKPNHGCRLGCRNHVGTYECRCPVGLTLDTDSKNCVASIPCPSDVRCTHGCSMVGGLPVCSCPAGSMLLEDDGWHMNWRCSGCTGMLGIKMIKKIPKNLSNRS